MAGIILESVRVFGFGFAVKGGAFGQLHNGSTRTTMQTTYLSLQPHDPTIYSDLDPCLECNEPRTGRFECISDDRQSMSFPSRNGTMLPTWSGQLPMLSKDSQWRARASQRHASGKPNAANDSASWSSVARMGVFGRA